MARDRKQAKLKRPLNGSKMSDALEQGARPLLLAAAGWNAAVTHSPEETESALQELARMSAKDSAQLGEHPFYITAASVRWPHGSSQRSR